MHQRSELETARTLLEMRDIMNLFENSYGRYPHLNVRRRTGIAKVVIEEYIPLFRLAEILPGFRSAYLTASSYSGPDAIISFNGGSQSTVQITCAGEDESSALKRELLDSRQIVFGNQKVERCRQTRDVAISGWALTTRAANTCYNL